MSAIFPSAVATQLQLLTAQNNSMVVLDANADLDDDVITVDDASALPNSGYLTFVDTDEVIYYAAKTSNTLTGVVRGADSTSPASHLAGVDLEQRWNADYHNIVTLELVAIETNLSARLGLSATQILAPVGTLGAPSYSFASHASTGMFYDGGAIALSLGGSYGLFMSTGQFIAHSRISTQTGGSAGGPGYYFDADAAQDSGMYLIGDGHIALSAGATKMIDLTATGVGIGGAPDSKSILALTSTTLGFLPPVMTTTQRDAIASPTNGLIIYNSTTSALNIYRSSAWKALLVPGLADIVNADISTSAAIAYSKLALTGAILNADLAGSIAYSKLSLTGAILNADLAGSIAYSKLSLTGAILNADLAGSIAVNKLVAQTASRALVSDGSGFITVATTTATEIGYVNGVTSAIQTQIDAKAALSGPTFTGNVIIDNQKEVRFREASGGGTNYFGIKAASAMSADVTVILPSAAPTANLQVLRVSDYTTGALEWGTGGSSGSGGINYISTNPDAETDTTGWAAYADAAATTPVDGTAGSPTLTITRTTSSPLRSTGMFTLTKDAANRQGNGASYAFTIDAADKATVLQISFDYQVSSAFVAGDSSDVRLFIYDVTNAVLITPAPYTLQGGTGVPHKFVSTFQTASNSTSYRLIFHVATTNASAWTMDFDNVIVGPQKTSLGAPIGDWTAYTPTFAGLGTVSAAAAFYRRVGDTVHIMGTVKNGTVSGSTMTISIPSGMAIDTTKVTATNTAFCGQLRGVEGPVLRLADIFSDGSDTTHVFIAESGTTGSSYTKGTGTGYFSSSDILNFYFYLPIAGWSSNVQMSSDTDTRVVAAIYENTAGTSVTNSLTVLPFVTKINDTHAAASGTGSSWVYTAPVAGYYRVTATIRLAAASWAVTDEISSTLYKNGSALSQLGFAKMQVATSLTQQINGTAMAYCNPGDTLAVAFYSDKNTSLSTTAGHCRVAIDRLSGPSTVAATETVSARFSTNASQSISNNTQTIVDFEDITWDSHGAVTTGASWKFTAPVSGRYRVCVSAMWATASVTTSTNMFLDLFKNGSSNSRISWVQPQASASVQIAHNGSDVVRLLAGEYIDLRIKQNTGGSVALDSGTVNNYVCIDRIGNY